MAARLLLHPRPDASQRCLCSSKGVFACPWREAAHRNKESSAWWPAPAPARLMPTLGGCAPGRRSATAFGLSQQGRGSCWVQRNSAQLELRRSCVSSTTAWC